MKEFCEALKAARTAAHISQEEMAERMNCSVRTVRKIERGIAELGIGRVRLWLEICGVNPFYYYLAHEYPEMFGSSTESSAAELRSSLVYYFQHVAGAREMQQIAFLIWGPHGSDWPAVLNMMTADLHCPLDDRYNICLTVDANYHRADARGELVCAAVAPPDAALLEKALASSKEAIYAGKPGYTSRPVSV